MEISSRMMGVVRLASESKDGPALVNHQHALESAEMVSCVAWRHVMMVEVSLEMVATLYVASSPLGAVRESLRAVRSAVVTVRSVSVSNATMVTKSQGMGVMRAANLSQGGSVLVLVNVARPPVATG